MTKPPSQAAIDLLKQLQDFTAGETKLSQIQSALTAYRNANLEEAISTIVCCRSGLYERVEKGELHGGRIDQCNTIIEAIRALKSTAPCGVPMRSDSDLQVGHFSGKRLTDKPIRDAKDWAKEMFRDCIEPTDVSNVLEYIRAIQQDALNSLRQKDGWRDIESAPRDGAWIFAWWPTMSISNYPAVVFADDHSEHDVWFLANNLEHSCVYPTHWRPLFQPPAAPLGRKDGGE